MEWISVKERVPDKKTRYAGRYGVRVITWDKQEHEDSGYCDPRELGFNFTKECFEDMLIGGSGHTSFLPTSVTHWQPLPEPPKT